MTRYMRKQYRFVDPILVKSTTSFLPFTWDMSAFVAENDAQRDMFKVATDFNIARGITVPIHNPGLRHSSLHVTADIPAKDLSRTARELENSLILIGIFLNATVSEKILARDVSPPIQIDRAREGMPPVDRKGQDDLGYLPDLEDRGIHCPHPHHKIDGEAGRLQQTARGPLRQS